MGSRLNFVPTVALLGVFRHSLRGVIRNVVRAGILMAPEERELAGLGGEAQIVQCELRTKAFRKGAKLNQANSFLGSGQQSSPTKVILMLPNEGE